MMKKFQHIFEAENHYPRAGGLNDSIGNHWYRYECDAKTLERFDKAVIFLNNERRLKYDRPNKRG